MADITEFINMLTIRIVSIAWGLFLLAWSIGWLLKGAPIPFARLKRTGQDLVEDAVWAAFWLAVGSSIFALISYVVSNVAPNPTVPQP
ncbi:DNA import protein CedA1 [Hyperthermus butylicus]|uniref:DNA import protein CedA1 n=1 Tax=Hyperthermus butylicus TaxID=54248 RepID=UPI0003250917|nr:DNA import protein CedA1 [Hyperthermus butylicus]